MMCKEGRVEAICLSVRNMGVNSACAQAKCPSHSWYSAKV